MQSKGVTQLAVLEKYCDELMRSLSRVAVIRDEFRDKKLGKEIVEKGKQAENALTRCRSSIGRKGGIVIAKGYK